MFDRLEKKNSMPAALFFRFDGGEACFAMAATLARAGMAIVSLCADEAAAQRAKDAGYEAVLSSTPHHSRDALLALLDGAGAAWPGIVTVDMEGGYSAEDVLAVARKLLEQPDRLVVAERQTGGQRGMLFRRERAIGGFLFRTMHGRRLPDPWSRLRGIPRASVRELLDHAGRRGLWLHMLLGLQRNGLQTAGVAVAAPYRREAGANTMSRVKDLLAIALMPMLYVSVSLSVLLIDNLLFVLFFYHILHGNRPVSIAIGRFTGAFVGYCLNRSVVFRHSGMGWRREVLTAGKYIALAAFNYGAALSLNYLFAHLSVGIFWSKQLADLVLYIFTFVFNREVVFRKKRRPEPGNPA